MTVTYYPAAESVGRFLRERLLSYPTVPSHCKILQPKEQRRAERRGPCVCGLSQEAATLGCRASGAERGSVALSVAGDGVG